MPRRFFLSSSVKMCPKYGRSSSGSFLTGSLVCQDYRRIVDQCAGDGHTLALPVAIPIPIPAPMPVITDIPIASIPISMVQFPP